MTDWRRNGADPHDFARERRLERYGGQMLLEWDARIIDVDAIAIVPTDGRLWIPYEQCSAEAEPIAVLEHKRPGEVRGSQVTQKLAKMAGLPWYLIIGHGPGDYEVRDAERLILRGDARELVRAIEMPRRLELRRER